MKKLNILFTTGLVFLLSACVTTDEEPIHTLERVDLPKTGEIKTVLIYEYEGSGGGYDFTNPEITSILEKKNTRYDLIPARDYSNSKLLLRGKDGIHNLGIGPYSTISEEHKRQLNDLKSQGIDAVVSIYNDYPRNPGRYYVDVTIIDLKSSFAPTKTKKVLRYSGRITMTKHYETDFDLALFQIWSSQGKGSLAIPRHHFTDKVADSIIATLDGNW